MSRSTQFTTLSFVLITLLTTACSAAATTLTQPTQPSLLRTVPAQSTVQQLPTTLSTIPANPPTDQPPQGSSQGSRSGGSIDPCKLVTADEVTGLLGSAPPPHPRLGGNGDSACDFSIDTGLLSIDAANNPQASAEFQIATSQIKNTMGTKRATSQGISIDVYGGNNADGNGTPGFTGFINKGDILVIVKLYSKTYLYNGDQAVALLQTMGERLP